MDTRDTKEKTTLLNLEGCPKPDHHQDRYNSTNIPLPIQLNPVSSRVSKKDLGDIRTAWKGIRVGQIHRVKEDHQFFSVG